MPTFNKLLFIHRRMTFKEDWIVVNEVPSRVKTWGGWVEDPLPEGDPVVICIPGNPGISSFYHSFLASLHAQLGVPVWIICHAGHELASISKPKYPKDGSLYDLAGQVAHKLAFIKQYVPANRRLYLIGHSVGAKIVSELLKDKQIAEHTDKSYLLMPTLERIADTPNGRFLTTILTYFMSVIIFFTGVFTMFPEKCRRFLIGCWFALSRRHQVDQWCMEAVVQLTQPKVLKNVFSLALDEMDKIKELDLKVLNAHCPKLKVYFAQTDNWAPLSYMDSLKKAKPEVDIAVLEDHFYHAFVLDNPEEMADVIAKEITSQNASS